MAKLAGSHGPRELQKAAKVANAKKEDEEMSKYKTVPQVKEALAAELERISADASVEREEIKRRLADITQEVVGRALESPPLHPPSRTSTPTTTQSHTVVMASRVTAA